MAASSGSTGMAERVRALVPAEQRWARAGIGLLIAVAVLSWGPRHRSRAARREQARPFETAARTGRLPAGADPATWRPFLVQRQQVLRQRTAVVLLAVAAVTVGSLVVVVLLTDAPVWTVVGVLLVTGQVMAWVSLAGRRGQRRSTALLDRLPDGVPADGAAG